MHLKTKDGCKPKPIFYAVLRSEWRQCSIVAETVVASASAAVVALVVAAAAAVQVAAVAVVVGVVVAIDHLWKRNLWNDFRR